MNKRETVKEIARCGNTFHVCEAARKALRGEVSLDRALHETAKHATTLYAKNIAEKAIDNWRKRIEKASLIAKHYRLSKPMKGRENGARWQKALLKYFKTSKVGPGIASLLDTAWAACQSFGTDTDMGPVKCNG